MTTVNTGEPAALMARMEELAKDPAFLRSLAELEKPEDVQKALTEKGVWLTVEELIQLRDSMARAAENGGELSEDELENVAGGMVLLMIGLGVVIASCFATIIGGCIVVSRRGW